MSNTMLALIRTAMEERALITSLNKRGEMEVRRSPVVTPEHKVAT